MNQDFAAARVFFHTLLAEVIHETFAIIMFHDVFFVLEFQPISKWR